MNTASELAEVTTWLEIARYSADPKTQKLVDALLAALRQVEVMRGALERLADAADCYGVEHLDMDDLDEYAEELQAATLAARAILADQPLPSVATGHPEQGALLSGVTAILRDAAVVDWGGVFRVSGAIYSDREGRWPDGERVTTSRVTERPGPDNLLRTRNSVYLIEGPLRNVEAITPAKGGE